MRDNAAVTDDAALGGRLKLLQPRRGHRFGHDAILLAAAVPAVAGEHVVDFGAGVGTAGLAVLARVPGARATLIEIDPDLAALARENIARNGMSDRAIVIALDVGTPAQAFAAAGLGSGSADHVLMNPPFNEASHQASPNRDRARAHVGDESLLATWLTAATRVLRPGGSVTVIWRAQAMSAVIGEVRERFGGVTALPILGTEGQPAIRVIVQGLGASRGEFALLPELALNDRMGRPSAQAEAILRRADALSLIERANSSSRRA